MWRVSHRRRAQGQYHQYWRRKVPLVMWWQKKKSHFAFRKQLDDYEHEHTQNYDPDTETLPKRFYPSDIESDFETYTRQRRNTTWND